MYKGKQLTKFETEIMEFIIRYELRNHKKPFLYEIAAEVGSLDRAVMKSLKRIFGDYPKHLIVTTRDKELFDMFEPGMSVTDLGNKAGISYDNVSNHKEGIERLGAKFKEIQKAVINPCKLKKDKEEKLIGIKVIHGIYKGKYGYLNNKLQAVIHIDGEPKAVEIESFDYVEIKC